MEYNSFYGGRRGASFVIVKNYPSIAEMVAAFKQGGAYKVVNYDEYVLIDTVNKNDKDNGKIYRRGYDFNNDIGGAIYEGQIVGPAGMAPHVEMTTIDEVEKLNWNEGLVDQDGNTYRKTSGKYGPTKNLIPGKYIENGIDKFNDDIIWAACSIRDKESHESTVHIGFKFPYTVIDYTAQSVDPYYNRDKYDSDFINQNLIERLDNGQHPFYEKWGISIPKGIKGDSLKNIRIITANSSVQPYTGQEDDIENQRKIIVCDYYHFDKDESGEPVVIYLGDYNTINRISLKENGGLIIDYTHDNDVEIPFNYIIKTAIDNRYHLLVYYADPAKRASAETKATWDGENDWTDLGYIGNGTGVGAIAGKEDDTGVSAVAATMPPYSAWLIVEE